MNKSLLYNLLLTLFVLIVLTIINVSCQKQSERTIIDRAGMIVNIKGPINRIVSTAPSNTEIIVDLGMAHKLVAIDKHSANITGIPAGLPLLDFFFPDAEVLVNLEPDIIIASGHNATGTGEDPFRLLKEMGIPVAYISMSKSIEDIYRDIAFIADVLQVQKKGNELTGSMQKQIMEIVSDANHKFDLSKPKRKVYFEMSAAPDMITFGKDSFINDMITIIGGRNIFEDDNWIVNPGAESIINRNPNVIFTNVNYIDDPVGEIMRRPGFAHIDAVVNKRVYQIDADSSVRSSSRIILALRQMADALYR